MGERRWGAEERRAAVSIKCESIEQSLLLQYERVFFEEICGLDTTGRESLRNHR